MGDELSTRFAEALDRFDDAGPLTGPPAHFHYRAIERLRAQGLRAILDAADDPFWDYLYATLAAWGLHRAGSATRLVEFAQYRDSLLQHRDAILALSAYRITGLRSPGELETATQAAQDLIDTLCVARSESRIVANSKALHHLLPDLIPPIDRRYTLQLFYGSMNPYRIRQCFSEVFPILAAAAAANSGVIDERQGRGLHSSPAKIVDNAVWGLRLLKSPPDT